MPRELRVALAEDAAELPALVRRADVLWAHNARPAGGTLAAITDVQEEAEDDPAFVFAVQPARGRGGLRGRGSGRGHGATRGRANSAAVPAAQAHAAPTVELFNQFAS